MSITFVRKASDTEMRRLNIRLPATTWEQLDRLVKESEADGSKIDVESTLAAALDALLREATGEKRKRGRKKEGSDQQS
jgi:hypothetical protein